MMLAALVGGCIGTAPQLQVKIDFVPDSIEAGRQFTIYWHFSERNPENISHSEVHLGWVAGELTERVAGTFIGTPEGECGPNRICLPAHPTEYQIVMEDGIERAMFLRIHGEPNAGTAWSDELKIDVVE